MNITNLIKLSVGTESLEELENWQKLRQAKTVDGTPRHITRMWPKREAELLNGGSIYWVIKGIITCRQNIIRLEEVIGHDGKRHCAIVLNPQLIRVTPAPKRAFQGWRYLNPEDAPADLPESREQEDELPVALQNALADIGLM